MQLAIITPVDLGTKFHVPILIKALYLSCIGPDPNFDRPKLIYGFWGMEIGEKGVLRTCYLVNHICGSD